MRALRRDGPAACLDLGELQIAATPPPPPVPSGPDCVCDGFPRVEALAARLGADPATGAERLIATGFARLGAEVVGLVDGEFAFVAWDAERRSGVIARDRTGARPLFLTEHGGGLLFASEVRGLIAALKSRPEPDIAALRRWLARRPLEREGTLYERIRRVPPGHLIELNDGRWRQHRYWRPAYRPPRPVGFDEAAGLVLDELEKSVAASLRHARRPALLLSGGLDSAVVAAAGGAAVGTGYSGLFPSHPEVDEADRVRRTRAALGLAGVEADLGGGSALGGGVEFMRAWELPSLSANRFVWSPLYRRAAADGADVLLTGDGGDDLFGCAPFLVADRLRSIRFRSAVRLSLQLPGMGDHPRPRWLIRAMLAYGVRGALPYGPHERLRALRGREGGPAWLADPGLDDRWAWKRDDEPRWWAHKEHLLVDDAVGTSEQASREAAMHGLAFRHPLRGPRLVELMLSLPPELSFDAELDRPLARRALAGRLPPEILRDVRKPAFNALLEDSLKGPDHGAVAELLAAPRPELRRLLRVAEVAALPRWLRVGAAPRALALDVWRIAAAELWLRHLGGDPLPRGLDGATDPS